MTVRLTLQGPIETPGSVQVLVEDDLNAFLFDCGAGMLAEKRQPPIDGVLISHAHHKHTAGLAGLPRDIPIYASVMTAAILKAQQAIAASSRESEMVFVADGDSLIQRPYTFLLTQNDSAHLPGQPLDTFPNVHEWWVSKPDLGREATIRPADVLPQVTPNALNGRALRHYPVDHSILGAAAIAVETPDGWVCYTGDVRFHGSQPGLMEEFVQGFSDLRPLALIVDGEHTEPGATPTTERDVHERVMEVISSYGGLVIADFDALDTERLLTFNGIAEMTGRQLVLTPRDAHFYLSMSIVWRQFPAFDAVDTFRILDAPQLDGSADGWEQELREQFGAILVSPDELRANGGDYILRASPSELGALGTDNGAYIHSRAAVDADSAALDQLRAMGLTVAGGHPSDPNHFHASGHATFDETIEMIRRIAPRHVVPVHSSRPEAFAEALAGDPITVALPPRAQPLHLA